jgi:peptidase E
VAPPDNAEAERRPAYHRLLRDGAIAPGFAIDDGAAIHFVSDQVYRVVASREGATAYRVQATGVEVREEPLPVEQL